MISRVRPLTLALFPNRHAVISEVSFRPRARANSGRGNRKCATSKRASEGTPSLTLYPLCDLCVLCGNLLRDSFGSHCRGFPDHAQSPTEGLLDASLFYLTAQSHSPNSIGMTPFTRIATIVTSLFEFRAGALPLLVSIPHAGTDVPEVQRAQMTDSALRLPDTDWFVPRLYDLPELAHATVITANVSRYVIDLNRPPSDENLYPGQNTTRLCPETNFDGSPVYRDGKPLLPQEILRRIEQYWRPYHDKLGRELDMLRARFGFAVLFDLHSIASRVPNLFDGVLPDLNFGTNHGQSVGTSFQAMINQAASSQHEYSAVVNGRFVGGFITRHYGDPERQIHAVQLELSQATYLDEATARWDDAKAEKIQIVLRQCLRSLVHWTAQEISGIQS